MVPAIFDSAFTFWDIGLISSPNTGCLFLMSLTAFGWEKISTQKIRIFFPKFYSLKAHAHYFTLFIYLPSWRAAKLDIFTHLTFTNLPRYSQNMNSWIYVYPIQIPSCFLWVLDHSRYHTSSYYHHPKKFFCVTPWYCIFVSFEISTKKRKSFVT